MVGDFRWLNTIITPPDRPSISHTQDFFAELRGCSVFSKIDLVRAFHQIPVEPDDNKKTPMTTPFGLLEWVRILFGLKNATQTFQRFIYSVVRDLSFWFAHIDDILTFSASPEENKLCLHLLLEHLQQFSRTGRQISAPKHLKVS